MLPTIVLASLLMGIVPVSETQYSHPLGDADKLQLVAKALYNVFLHPLRQHPGPKSWAATRVPWCWHQYRGRLNHRLVELHRQYGSTVRVAPDELSYNSESAWKTIYGQRSVEMSKDAIFSLVTPTGVPSESSCKDDEG